MIKNRLFACCMALASALLWIASSEAVMPKEVVKIIAEYAEEPRAIEASKKTYPNRVPCWYKFGCSREYGRMRDFKPEDFSFSSIDMSSGAPVIELNNVYTTPLAAGQAAHCFMHIRATTNGLASWNTEIEHARLNNVTLEHMRQKQDPRTQESRACFGSALVPDDSSASFFADRNMLVVADATTVTTYNTTDQAFPAIDAALNPQEAPQPRRCCSRKILSAVLSSGVLVASAAAAYAASQS